MTRSAACGMRGDRRPCAAHVAVAGARSGAPANGRVEGAGSTRIVVRRVDRRVLRHVHCPRAQRHGRCGRAVLVSVARAHGVPVLR